MATIDSLPPEAILHILKLGSPWPANILQRPSESYSFLCSASLIARALRAAAQERLGMRVVIRCSVHADALIGSGNEQGWRTVKLVLVALSSEETVGAINACTGLRSVTIFTRRSFWNALQVPAMKGTLLVCFQASLKKVLELLHPSHGGIPSISSLQLLRLEAKAE